ncbi:hypothetical protein SeMB42_g07920 [Synchytrium endobioticum]|uniref:NEDD8-activating enzyme E1 catalytic subunit n=1 Tax=Synchytrium endobioticum TaxID=286115 RepID=A0A507C9I7_9FUNG|nr:hypothetical protein SeMB42_g07920 [Synchytrium endobioticum]TPX35829.1 hypothetical protein SeLEV6574_g08143 [Synchytrium endobioticum]
MGSRDHDATAAAGDAEMEDAQDMLPSYEPWPDRWRDIDYLLNRVGPYATSEFIPGDELKDVMRNYVKILVIGAGGLGCELLKDLALTGFRDIHVVDMDTIDVSNLNRQFLFRMKDVGKPKATVAAEFVMRRAPGVRITPYFGRIQDKDESYYEQFHIIICGLDSVDARRWINSMIVGMYIPEDETTRRAIVDGGTEGVRGQARVIIPGKTACFECSLDLQTKPVTFPICTIANTPRLPEHCIEWASVMEWPKHFPDQKVDGDDPDHIRWLLEKAQSRAKEFNIQGVTYSLTQGVVKNIIPAIASTNALVAAACANEAFKLISNCAPYLDNYMTYNADAGLYTNTFPLDRKLDCPVCGSEVRKITVKADVTLQDFFDTLAEIEDLRLKAPSATVGGKSLYIRGPPSLEEMLRPNLPKKLRDLLRGHNELAITDPSLAKQIIRIIIKFD